MARADKPTAIFGFLKSELRGSRKASGQSVPKGPLVKLAGTWFQTDGMPPPKPHKSGVGENSLSAMASFDADPVLKALVDLARGAKAMEVGVRTAPEGSPIVFRFVDCIPEDQVKVFDTCLSAMLEQVGKELEPKR